MAATTLRVLLIEDSENDAALAIREFSKAGYTIISERVDSRQALISALQRGPWDLAIADYAIPGFSGSAALAVLRQYDTEMPFIFVSGTIGEETAVAAMKAGAHDYIMKGNLTRLVPAVERELREVDVRRSRKQAEARLAHLAYHDPLTDLPNRILLHDRLQQAVLVAQRAQEPLAFLVMDLDGFKAVNDGLGHHLGDHVLQQVAVRLRSVVRDVDTVARLGGDEFALVLPCTDGEQGMHAARKVLHALKQPLVVGGHSVNISGSLGIAWLPEHGSDSDTLLQKADIAMYVAKNTGLGIAVYSPHRDQHAHRELAMLSELRTAIEQDQFLCEYQPIVCLDSLGVVAVEMLARWQHPRHGVLPPGDFIPLAEQSGMIEPLTMLLLDKALTEWSQPGAPPSIQIAVNLSVRNLRDPNLPDRVADVLQLRGVPASALALEITENLMMADPAHCLTCLARLRQIGVTLAVDDFGTGYSSFSYLRHLPVDQLKIDRSFVTGQTTHNDAIVRTMIDLGHKLGLRVIAEGVESAAVLERLRELGCDAAQGTFVAPPRPVRDTRQWLALRMQTYAAGPD